METPSKLGLAGSNRDGLGCATTVGVDAIGADFDVAARVDGEVSCVASGKGPCDGLAVAARDGGDRDKGASRLPAVDARIGGIEGGADQDRRDGDGQGLCHGDGGGICAVGGEDG